MMTDLLFLNNKLPRERGKISFLIRRYWLWVKIYIDALYSNEMFYSVACWNNDVVVNRELKNLNSKSYKLLALKLNIRMGVIGLGWENLRMHCSKNGKSFTLEELASHLKMIVSNQRSWSILSKPLVLLPAQKALPQLGTQAPDFFTMDASCLDPSDEFEKQSRRTIL